MANSYVEVQPRSDAYTGILVVSLATLMIGCLLLFLDYNQYGSSTPPAPNVPALTPQGGGPKAGPAAGPGAGGAGMPGGGAPADGGAPKQ